MKSALSGAISVLSFITVVFICCQAPSNPLKNPSNTKLNLFSADEDTVVEVNVAHRVAAAFILPMHVKSLHLKSSCENFDTTVLINSAKMYDTLYFNPVFTSAGICTLIATAEMIDELLKDRTDNLVLDVQPAARSLNFTSVPDNYATCMGRMDTLLFAVSRKGIAADSVNFSLVSQPSLDSEQLFLLTSESNDTATIVFAPVEVDSVRLIVHATAGTFRDSAMVSVRVYRALAFSSLFVPESIMKGKPDTLVFVADNNSRQDSIRMDLLGNYEPHVVEKVGSSPDSLKIEVTATKQDTIELAIVITNGFLTDTLYYSILVAGDSLQIWNIETASLTGKKGIELEVYLQQYLRSPDIIPVITSDIGVVDTQMVWRWTPPAGSSEKVTVSIIGHINDRVDTLTLNVTFHQDDKPDLEIDTLFIDPENPTEADSITISVRVKNIGKAAAGTSKTALLIEGTSTPVLTDIPKLNAKESHIFTYKTQLAARDSLNITAFADSGNVVEESDESNNQGSITITVTQSKMPDLEIDTLFIDPENPTEADSITISVRVKNIGKAAAGTSRTALLIEGTSTPVLTDIPELDSGESHIFTYKTQLAARDSLNITAFADSGNVVEESDESNNTQDIIITIGQPLKPDLVIDTILVDPVAPTTGDTITFTVRVKNIGLGSAGAFKTALRIGGEANPTMLNIPALSAESIFNATRKVRLMIDQGYTALAFVDSGNAVFETNELNNEKSITFSVNTSLIAHYPLKFNGNDTLGVNSSMTLSNTPFVAGGIVCNGIYSGTDRCVAITPALTTMDLNSFTIKAEFKVDEFPTVAKGTPVFVGGNSYRWIGFTLGIDSTVYLLYNNSNRFKTTLRYTTGKWYEAKVTYNGVSGACYLDDSFGGTVNFTLEHNDDKNVGITNYSNSTTFKGVFRNLHISNTTTETGPVVAYYPLLTNANEADGRANPMTLTNTSFVTTGRGVICAGVYSFSGGSIASTPDLALDHNSFSIKFRFSISETPQNTMPVLFLSRSSRTIGFQIEPSRIVSMCYNNSNVAAGTHSVSLNTEHEGEIIYNSQTGTGKVLIDSVVSASDSFTIVTPSSSDITTANYSNGTAFKGVISDIRVYSR